jgi:hypothetical protein
MKKTLSLAAATLFAGVLSSSAAVTVQGWWHLDIAPTPTLDSSGNGRNFLSAYSTHPAAGGNMGALAIANGAGGPLDGTGWISAQCIRLGVGVGGRRQSAMWGLTGAYNPPATNYGIEIWVMPQDRGIAGGSGGWIFSSGQGGGVALRVNSPNPETSYLDAFILGTGVTIGNQVPINTNKWMHLAIVNDAGTLTFYTNGVPCGASVATGATAPSGDCYIGTPNDNEAYDGYLDEARMFTFAPGAFTTNDLLLRPPGPNIVAGPASATVWDGGAAPFSVTASFDNTITYQWRRGGGNVAGATTSRYVLPTVTSADNGASLTAVLSGGSLSTTSAPAVLTVVAPSAGNVNAYRSAVNGEASLLAYFPADGDTAATLTNTKDGTHNGTLLGGAAFDGRTNRAFGQRALLLGTDSAVSVPANNAYAFGAGSGTLEAVIYLASGTVEDPTIFAEAYDGTSPSYRYAVSRDGSSLIYASDVGGELTWTVAPNLIGRRAHVVFVVQNGTNVTPYVDGISLGTKTTADVSYSFGAPAWIGATGSEYNLGNRWVGNLDELAIYGTALSANTVQTHFSKYFFGTNTAPPSITSQPQSKTLLAGGSPVLRVRAAGTLPLTYQWTSNGVPIAGATTESLTLANTTTGSSATYSLNITNAFGWTNTQPIALTFAAPGSPYATAIAAAHPTAYWRLGETSGTTAVDAAGFNDGIYYPAETLGVSSILPNETNPAVDFGSGAGRVEVANTPELNPAGPYSVEVWTKPNAGAGGVIISSQNRNNSRGGFSFHANIFIAEYGVDIGAPGAQVYRFASATVPQAGVPVHLVYTYDGVNGAFYLDGQLQASGAIPTYVNNVVAPLTIGKRSDNAAPWNGVVDEAVVYSYALTQEQVSNHWSYVWAPAVITQNPASVTTNEWATISLTGAATGTPNTYQWQKGGVDLVAVNNPDGTAHYPSGVTSPTLVIAQVHPADNGQYRLVVNNPVAGATSTPATVTVTPDTTKPTVTKLTGLGTPNIYGGPTPFLMRVDFSERVNDTTATTAGNYVFSGGVTASSVQLSADGTKAYVSTSGLTPGQKYTVNISGVTDQAQTPNTMNAAVKTLWVPMLADGLLWDFYPGVANGVANLLANPYYPYAPYTNLGTATFDSTPITGGNLNNQPAFAGIGETYGCSLSGWITPAVTTNYYFFISSDDASELWLSSNDDPLYAAPIAQEPTCCRAFQEPGTATTTSAAMPLTAGQRYFIRALQTEGAGGDFVKVAWKMEGDPTAATNLVPISGSVLKAYVPLAQPRFNPPTRSGNQVIISWTGLGTLVESTDLNSGTWTPVPGNPSSPYPVTPTLPQKYYRIEQ